MRAAAITLADTSSTVLRARNLASVYSVSLYRDPDGEERELPDQRQQQQRAEHGEGGRHGGGQLRAQPRGGVGDEDQDRVVVQRELACTGVDIYVDMYRYSTDHTAAPANADC